MKQYKVTISRTETTHYDVYVDAYGQDDASDRAYQVFIDADLETELEQYTLESSEHVLSVEDVTVEGVSA